MIKGIENYSLVTVKSTLIYLVGFMGSGKSYWGRDVADSLGFDFIDLDDYIEEKQKTSIRMIFRTKGEEFFRKLEQQALKEISMLENTVVSLGGGTPCFFDNMNIILQSGLSFYLNTPVKTLQRRLVKEADKRPLIASLSSDELIAFIEKKLNERSLFYKQSNVIVDTTLENVMLVIQQEMTNQKKKMVGQR